MRNMVSMNHSFELDCDVKNLFKILTNYENLTEHLPRKIQKIEILDRNENFTTISATLFLRTLIKKEFSQKLKIIEKSKNNLVVEVLDGHAKGTNIEILISSEENKTRCQVNTNIKLSLKTIVLLPILKAEYKVFISNTFKKIAKASKEIKI